jgi:N-methylhydantoinase B
VREGWVSAERARDVYGVVVADGPDGERVVDAAATEACRRDAAG